MSFDIMNNILLNYGLSKENLKKGGKRGGFLGKEIRNLVKLGQNGGNGNSNTSKNIINSFSSDLNNFKYEWFKNSCWIDASLVSLLGMGETNLTTNIRKNCNENNDEFCKFITNFMSAVNNDYKDYDLKMTVKNKMIFYNKLTEKLKKNYRDTYFNNEDRFGSASPIYDLLLSYGGISYDINFTGKFDISKITDDDVNTIKSNVNLTFTINNNKLTYEIKNKKATISITNDSYNDLFSENPQIPFSNYYQQIKGFSKATQIELEKFIFIRKNVKTEGFVKKSTFDVNETQIIDDWYSRTIDTTQSQASNKNSNKESFNNFNKKNNIERSYTLTIIYTEKYVFDVPIVVLTKIGFNKIDDKNSDIKQMTNEIIKKFTNLVIFYKEYGEIFGDTNYYDKNGTINIYIKDTKPWLYIPYQNLNGKDINDYINDNLKDNKHDILVLDVDSFYDKEYWTEKNYKIDNYELKSSTITSLGGGHYLSLIEYEKNWYVIDVMRKTVKKITDLKDKLNKATFLIYKKAKTAKAKTANAKTANAKTAKAKTAKAKTAKAKTANAKTANAKTANAKTANAKKAEPAPKKKVEISFKADAKNPLDEAKKTFQEMYKIFGTEISIETIDNNNLKEMEDSKKELKDITTKLIESTIQLEEGISNFKSDYDEATKRKIVREITDKEDVISKKMKEITRLFNSLF